MLTKRDVELSRQRTNRRITIMFYGSLIGFFFLILSFLVSLRLFLWLGFIAWSASILIAAFLRAVAILQRKRTSE